ncbi:MAG: hypothetical protein ACKVRP_13255 [Bacteroidota bacterium]
MSHVNIFVFCCSMLDAGWPSETSSPDAMREEFQILDRAMLVDLAERLAETEGFSVVIHETDEYNLGGMNPSEHRFNRNSQRRASLSERMAEATARFFLQNEGSSLVVVYGRNPLFPTETFREMEALLHEEEEVIAITQQRKTRQLPGVVAVAMRSLHPCLFVATEEKGAHQIEPFLEAQAMLIPVLPTYDFAHPDGLPLLLHEVERRVLLRQWYPVRTHAILQTMHRKGVFQKL